MRILVFENCLDGTPVLINPTQICAVLQRYGREGSVIHTVARSFHVKDQLNDVLIQVAKAAL
jgi:hypothetical protein